MDGKMAVRAMAAATGNTYQAISERCGRGSSWLGHVLNKPGDFTASTIARAAGACGYKLALVPENSVPQDSFVIDATHEGDGRPGRKPKNG